MTDAGVDVVTLGNHTWDKEEVMTLLEETPRLIRPMNYTAGAPGLGYTTVTARTGERVTVAQAMGRIFMPPTDNPFQALDILADEIDNTLIVDFHAEATSEKRAMGQLLAGAGRRQCWARIRTCKRLTKSSKRARRISLMSA